MKLILILFITTLSLSANAKRCPDLTGTFVNPDHKRSQFVTMIKISQIGCEKIIWQSMTYDRKRGVLSRPKRIGSFPEWFFVDGSIYKNYWSFSFTKDYLLRKHTKAVVGKRCPAKDLIWKIDKSGNLQMDWLGECVDGGEKVFRRVWERYRG